MERTNDTQIKNLEKDCAVFKGLYKNQINLTHYWADKANALLDKYILLAYNSSLITGETEAFWGIVEEEKYAGFKYTFYTEIKDYTNKKGRTHKAHFVGSKYIGSVKKLGDKPEKKTFYGRKQQAEQYFEDNENYKNMKFKKWIIIIEEKGENKRVVFKPQFTIKKKK